MTWQATLGGSITYGAPTDTWRFDGAAGDVLPGLGNIAYRLNDLARGHADGSGKGPAFRDVAPLGMALVAHPASVAAALSLVDALNAAWAPLPGGTTTTLALNLDGHTYSFDGAPTGCAVSLVMLKSRLVRALCTFTIYNGTSI